MANGETGSHFDAPSSPQPSAEQKAKLLEDKLLKDQAAEVDETLEAVNQQKGDLVGQVEKTLDIKKFGAEKLKAYLDFRIGKIGDFLTTKIDEINSTNENDKIKKINTHILGFDFKGPNKLPNHFANTFPVLEKNILLALQSASADDKPKFQTSLDKVKNITQIFLAKKIENITQANDILTKLQPILSQITAAPTGTEGAAVSTPSSGADAGADNGAEQEIQTLNGLQVSSTSLEKFGDSNITFRTQGQKIGTDKIGLFLTNATPAIKFVNGNQTKDLGLMEEDGQPESSSNFLIKSSDYTKIDFDGKKLILTKKDNTTESWNIVDSTSTTSTDTSTTAGETQTGSAGEDTATTGSNGVDTTTSTDAGIEQIDYNGIKISNEAMQKFGEKNIALQYAQDGIGFANIDSASKYQIIGADGKSIDLKSQYIDGDSGETTPDKIFSSKDFTSLDLDGDKIIFTKKDGTKETWTLKKVDSTSTTNTGTTNVAAQADSSKEKIGDYDIPKNMIDSLKSKGINLLAQNTKDFLDNDIGLKLDYGTNPNLEFSVLDSDGTNTNNIRSDLLDEGKNPIVGLPKNATDITFDTNTQVTDLAGYYQLNIHYKQDGKDFTLMIIPNSESLPTSGDSTDSASTDATADSSTTTSTDSTADTTTTG